MSTPPFHKIQAKVAAIDVEQLEAAVRAAAEARPDHFVESCNYGGRVNQCCVIGAALTTLGFTAAERRSLDRPPPCGSANQIGAIHPDVVDGDWLQIVQSEQDDGFTWGTAVARADRENV